MDWDHALVGKGRILSFWAVNINILTHVFMASSLVVCLAMAGLLGGLLIPGVIAKMLQR